MTELVRARTEGMEPTELPRGVPPRKATRRRSATEEAAANDVILTSSGIWIDVFTFVDRRWCVIRCQKLGGIY